MIRIAIGGLRKEEIRKAVKETGGEQVETTISSDFEASKMVQAGKADYYLGACHSGGGAALSVAIGLLGYTKCSTVAKAGGRPRPSEIERLVREGKIAFGMSVEAIEEAVPMIIQSILQSSSIR
ncbi:DUF2620 domain-containing protein [Paludifilum halophilum]|uniref:DUF2620 domain-containing protein n=1 Tax=Paludifilum halophilum TaxID=1642702 RepID=A0A235B3J6_9BACL|nr:DUF2620 domain-containing protein [Paludifilum halophilum]OYD06811.1 hypothetical protein CHM34_14760 [Paludifilum halophilum]